MYPKQHGVDTKNLQQKQFVTNYSFHSVRDKTRAEYMLEDLP